MSPSTDVSARVVVAVVVVLLLGLGNCQCNKEAAACEQTLLALCEHESICAGGEAIDACVSARGDFTCTVDVTGAEACVDGINDAIREGCPSPGADLPCPLLTQAGLYEPCGGDLVCAAARECGEVAGASLCTEPCDVSTPCPEGGGCSEADRCGPACGAGFDCATDHACVEDRCVLCSEACSGCDDFVDGCACGELPGCEPDCAAACETCDAVVEGCDCATLPGCPGACAAACETCDAVVEGCACSSLPGCPCALDGNCGEGGVCVGGVCE